MKIEQIDLKAYGHFTAQRLTLGGAANLHIICGPNEAGKTTLWRAINGALFGIPERTQDGFLHEAKKLRIGLSLSARSGERLAVMRRKGRVNTLLKYDPTTGDESPDPVSEERLRDWLDSVERLVCIELGAGTHIPTVRRFSEQAGGRLIRINPLEAALPDPASGLSLPLGALAGCQALADYLPQPAEPGTT